MYNMNLLKLYKINTVLLITIYKPLRYDYINIYINFKSSIFPRLNTNLLKIENKNIYF